MLEDLWDQYFQEHFDTIWRFVRRRTSTAADADDITAETFAVAWRRREELPEPDLRPWLFGVARMVLLNHTRAIERQGRLHQRIAEVAPGVAAIDAFTPADSSVWIALSALSAEDRDLLIMRAWDELAVSEIATILGCTTNAASGRLHKARVRLADELRRYEDGDADSEVMDQTALARSNRDKH